MILKEDYIVFLKNQGDPQYLFIEMGGQERR